MPPQQSGSREGGGPAPPRGLAQQTATIAPFILGWVVAAPLLGAYSPGAAESSKAAVPLALRSWLLADVVALGLRATPLFHGGVELSFVAVTFVAGPIESVR